VKPLIPRLRMFAGPNGSGKSCLNGILEPSLRGVYLNPDELEQQLKINSILDLKSFSLDGAAKSILKRISKSQIHSKSKFTSSVHQESPDTLSFDSSSINSYLASSLVEAMRFELLDRKISLTFETVMSHPSKVEFLKEAKKKGYRTYLYYIATEDPEINISRVENRVIKGGHSVPKNKIKSRYLRSLDLLYDAIKASDRAYLFDNSSDGKIEVWVAEINDGTVLTLKTKTPPLWLVKAVLNKIAV